ncbi:hypothetical protein [Butyrivibrio sp. VCD2006]|uniref:hypothetical protein n=1 Tax=Butyrivibrio sp. VCD2006 TaxID=1280664 RepID=UPI0003FFACF1|nr:hypothetical protein [Butyrivibrio sp. VCD2006]
MKRILKQLSAIVLIFALAFSFAPIKTQAAGVKLTKSRSGKISSVMYKGARPKKASFKLSSTLLRSSVKASNQQLYDEYEVSISLTLSKLSKKDIMKIVQEAKKRNGGQIDDYTPIYVDKNGNSITDLIVENGSYVSRSSTAKTLVARKGRHVYRIYNWKKKIAYSYKVLVPLGHDTVYLGYAGLRNGQLKKATMNKLNNKTISYYAAGFGKNKKGYAMAGSIQ